MPDLDTILKASEPSGTTVTTPSGLEIYYQSEPDRHYKVNGVRVPSVSTVTKMLPADGLPWWGMKVGLVGAAILLDKSLFQDHRLVTMKDLDDKTHPLLGLMKEHGLATHQVLSKAGDRGTSVHLGLERWAETGHLPNSEEWPEEERGYVAALRKFLEQVHIEPLHSELMVASEELRFAGRFDLFGRTQEQEIIALTRAKRKVPAGKGIIDLKTSKGIYLSHFYQTAGYEGGMDESGYGRADYGAVLQVGADGRFDFQVSPKRFHNFVNLRRLYEDYEGR